MSQPNKVSFNLTEEELAEVRRHLELIRDILAPHLVTLSPEDRQELPKMGEKTVDFVQKGAQHCSQNPTLVPPFLDVPELLKDVKAVEILRAIYNPMFQLTQGVSDTMLLSGSESYGGVLVFYQAVRNAAKLRVPNAQAIYDDLATRFPGRPKKSGGEPEA